MTTDQASAGVIGYTYQADNYCPSCIVDQLPTGDGGTFDGWALAAGAAPMSTEANLSEIAAAFGIDRDDETTFESGEFPKVILAEMVTDDRCGACDEYLLEQEDDGSLTAAADAWLLARGISSVDCAGRYVYGDAS